MRLGERPGRHSTGMATAFWAIPAVARLFGSKLFGQRWVTGSGTPIWIEGIVRDLPKTRRGAAGSATLSLNYGRTAMQSRCKKKTRPAPRARLIASACLAAATALGQGGCMTSIPEFFHNGFKMG